MKLESQSGDAMVFRLSPRERDTLMACLRIGDDLDPGPAELSRHSGDALPPDAEGDLRLALDEHRREASLAARRWLSDPERCQAVSPDLLRWHLSVDEVDRLLRTVNQLRMGAWDRLGRPDFGQAELPDIDETDLPMIWILQVTERVLAVLMSALAGED